MPRPGPRPYECVRRAWHSERHQPIRGSLIQEIFRVVSEIHSSKTKRNKEWQEKLPIVVLKAEEIMYSKANSEAEYMDFQTLWDRANDAINTVIRRDDSEETGDLLQPCIEAALHLGCIPRRASRSQRDNDPRCYLSPNPQEPMSSWHFNLKYPKYSITSSHRMAKYSDIFNPAGLSSTSSVHENIPLHFPPQTNSSKLIAPDTCTAEHSVYPLYYWSSNQSDDPQLRCNSFPKKTRTNDMAAPNKPEADRYSEMPQSAPLSCDLSLRLGPYCGSEDIDKQGHCQEFRNTKSMNTNSKELHLFPEESAAKNLQADESSQKRKALLPLTLAPCPAGQMLCYLQPKLLRNGETKMMKYPGS
ncbi:unnamed protein product [Rhodiola kirilowii]